MNYTLALDTWGKEEHEALQRVIKSNRYSMGREVAEFEIEICVVC